MISFRYIVAMSIAMALFVATSPAPVTVAPDVLVKPIAREVLETIKGDKAPQAGDPRKLAELAGKKVALNFDFRRGTPPADAWTNARAR
jgi:ABC-type transporter MlaC component